MEYDNPNCVVYCNAIQSKQQQQQQHQQQQQQQQQQQEELNAAHADVLPIKIVNFM